MLSALLADLEGVLGWATLEMATLCHPQIRHPSPGQRLQIIRTADEESAFHRLARSADFSLVIAPELDDVLLDRSRWVEEAGGRLLGSSPDAVQLAGDKLALGQRLRQSQVPSPECFLVGRDIQTAALSFPMVWKPRQGAGSTATFLVRHFEELTSCVHGAQAEGWQGESLLQAFVPGQPASVALLMGPKQRVTLPPATQELSNDGRFRYLGGQLPFAPALAERAVSLAERAVTVVPGLAGYVGVDVVLGDAADGSRDWVIEINPRWTTSYVGLRALARTNLAEAWLRVTLGEEVPRLAWRPGPVAFRADGTIDS
jgi:predicted ATP-grasp superfamily ATP-dependent carboligase